MKDSTPSRRRFGLLLWAGAFMLAAAPAAAQPQPEPPPDRPPAAEPTPDPTEAEPTPGPTEPAPTSTEPTPQQPEPADPPSAEAAPEQPAPEPPTARPAPKVEPLEPEAYHLDEYDFDPDEICPFCEITPQWPKGRRGLHWHGHWNTVGWPEYISTPLLFGLTFAVDPLTPDLTEAKWSSPILFDDAVRDSLVAKSEQGQQRTQVASDVLFFASVAYPVVIDNFLVTWIGRQSPRVAWQIFVINAQSYALASALNVATKRIAARERPWGTECPDAPNQNCDAQERYRSFYSGHATITATGAGLTCAHHTQLSLYKNPAMDTAACLTAVGFTAATGVLRMSSDNHWASDVLAGHLMGYLAGYLFPTLMYYREFRISPEHEHEHHPVEPSGPIWAVLPIVQPSSAQLSAVGVF